MHLNLYGCLQVLSLIPLNGMYCIGAVDCHCTFWCCYIKNNPKGDKTALDTVNIIQRNYRL